VYFSSEWWVGKMSRIKTPVKKEEAGKSVRALDNARGVGLPRARRPVQELSHPRHRGRSRLFASFDSERKKI